LLLFLNVVLPSELLLNRKPNVYTFKCKISNRKNK
jgi:hypothetical protein